MIPTDLFEFAYVPDWYGQLDELAAMALPESWRFKKPTAATKNTDTPILERDINMIFRKQSIDYNTEPNPNKAAKFFHVENEEEIRTVELEPKAMNLYKQLEKESFAELAGSDVSAMNVLTKMLRLSQMTGGHLTDDEGDTAAVSTVKLDALSDILDTMLAEDKKLVIMARFVPELNDIQKLLEKKNIGYASVRGGISNRAEEIRKFQEDADCRRFSRLLLFTLCGILCTTEAENRTENHEFGRKNR